MLFIKNYLINMSLSPRFALSLIVISAFMVPLTASAVADDSQPAITEVATSVLQSPFAYAVDALTDLFVQAGVGAQPATVALVLADDFGDDTVQSGIYCPRLTSTIQKGARDANSRNQVSELQVFLTDYFNLDENVVVGGYFGNLTQKYVIAFQTEKGLPALGIVGQLTRAAIASVCGNQGQSTTTTSVATTTPTVSPLPPQQTVGISGSSSKPGYSIGEPIDLSWDVVNAPANTQTEIHLKLVQTTGEVSGASGGTWDSQLLPRGSSKGTYNWVTGPTHLEVPGVYEVKMYVVQCDPQGCGFNSNPSITVGEPSRRSYAAAPRFNITVTAQNNNQITVTAPNGGEKWELGTLQTITWRPYEYYPNAVNPASDVSAFLEKKVNSNFETVSQIFEEGKASIHTYFRSTTSEGTLKDPVPGEYYVRIVNNKTGATDRSDRAFTLVKNPIDLKIDGSDGPVSVAPGKAVTASWTSKGMLGCQLHGATALLTDLGPIGSIEVMPVAQGITLYCNKGDDKVSYNDTVRLNFKGADAAIKVLTPNGGEQLPWNQPMAIRWSMKGTNATSLALYKNDKWYAWITRDAAGDKSSDDTYSYHWNPQVADVETGKDIYKIYVLSQKADGSGSLEDKSDRPFRFTPSNTDQTPVQSFSASPTSGRAPLLVEFTANLGDGGQYTLEYGDGASETVNVPVASCAPVAGQRCPLPTLTRSHTYQAHGTYTAKLLDYNQTILHTRAVTVSAAAKPSCTLKASSPSVQKPGKEVVLTWTSKNATYAEGPGGKEEPNGSKKVKVNETTTYRKTVAGPGGTASCTVTVEAPASEVESSRDSWENTGDTKPERIINVFIGMPFALAVDSLTDLFVQAGVGQETQTATTALSYAGELGASAIIAPFSVVTNALTDALVSAGVGQPEGPSVLLELEYVPYY